ncbi:Mu transposase C-terminal domain-containing protein [Methylobacterium sp. 391_Methyba4]|uniref:Mu transposase C-terminal domain-containing protein n=1 Tax=Methylobacterium sp. 391_Methyba4 TaxID=3038924 RepID=UPI00241D0F90|nr:Mu transposase C-terminal domain-containing protein [Methylobacterium sp. 391_Methyba4]WFS09713.1 Mu transposase C-terminal domain-containing protein [Methylobacterium sp. 391_Methyba4]
MVPANLSNGARLRLGVSDAVTIHGVAYHVVGDCPEGYVLRNVATGLPEEFAHARLADLSAKRHLEFSADHYGAISVRTRMMTGAGSIAALPVEDQTIIARRLEWITPYEELRAAWHLENAGKPRSARKGPSIESNAGIKAALVEIGKTVQAQAEARARPLAEDGTLPKARKTRCGSETVVYAGPSVRTFRSWLEAYEAAGRNPLALRRKTMRCGNRRPRYAPQVESLLQKHAASFASEKHPTREACHRNLRADLDALNAKRKADGLAPYPVPSDRTLSKRIDALDMFLVEAKKLGVDRATRKHRFIVGKAEAIRPGQRVEMDEWKIDLFFLLSQTDLLKDLTEEQLDELRKRRWFLCVAIDVATRCVLGMRVDQTASVRNAISTLEMVVSDKGDLAAAVGAVTPSGHMALRPEDVVTDSGGSFIDPRFHLTVLGLGSGHDIPPAGMPHLRGTIERLFRTLSLQLVREFTGQSFGSKAERGDYPAMQRVSVTVEDFVLAALRYALDVYHNLPHQGLGGETPANAWNRLTDHYGVIPIPGRNERRAIFGLRFERVLGRHGLRFMGLHYRGDVLRDLYLKRGGISVPVRVDPQDIGALSVEIDGSWHEVQAATTGFDGVSLADHRALCEQLAKRYADQAKLSQGVVFEALRAIQARASAAEKAATFLARFAEPEDIERAERSLRTFTIPSDADFADVPVVDPFTAVIPTGGAPLAGTTDPQDRVAPERKPRPARPRPVEPEIPAPHPPKKRPGIGAED